MLSSAHSHPSSWVSAPTDFQKASFLRLQTSRKLGLCSSKSADFQKAGVQGFQISKELGLRVSMPMRTLNRREGPLPAEASPERGDLWHPLPNYATAPVVASGSIAMSCLHPQTRSSTRPEYLRREERTPHLRGSRFSVGHLDPHFPDGSFATLQVRKC